MSTFSRETSLDPWYVTGLSEGAGSFTFSRNGRQLNLLFVMKMPDVDLLQALAGFFGVGAIYETPHGGDYRVVRRDDLDVIVEHFDRHPLRGVKAERYAIWKKMVALRRDSYRRPPRESLNDLAEKLRATRR
jgi:hypothetical protein